LAGIAYLFIIYYLGLEERERKEERREEREREERKRKEKQESVLTNSYVPVHTCVSIYLAIHPIFVINTVEVSIQCIYNKKTQQNNKNN